MVLATQTRQPHWRFLALGVETGALLVAALAGAALVLLLGPVALLYLLGVLAVAASLLHPRPFAVALAITIMVVDPNAMLNPGDFMGPLSEMLYVGPPELVAIMPLTMPPAELLMLATAFSLLLRAGPQAARATALPRLFIVAAMMLGFGMMWGLARGGPYNMVYHEARGLIFGTVAFFIAYRLRDTSGVWLRRAILTGTAAFALTAILRYELYFSGGGSSVAFSLQYAHEDVIYLGYGFTYGAIALVRERTWSGRFWLGLHVLLLLAAAMVTGRRAAVMVVGVAALVMLWLLLPKRTVATVAFAGVLTVVGAVYLAAFWDQPYGPLAQPARAVRSQIAPDDRDLASDGYRAAEDYNKLQTIRLNPIAGIGFGHEFQVFEPLPDQTAWWPMQFFTGENNLLWLWLKTGYFGAAALLGIWALALSRCLRAIRETPPDQPLPVLPIVLSASLILHIAFAQLDQGLSATRAAIALGVVLAIAVGVPLGTQAAASRPASEPRRQPERQVV